MDWKGGVNMAPRNDAEIVRKVALLVTTLDPALANSILGEMPADLSQRVQDAIKEAPFIDESEVGEILHELQQTQIDHTKNESTANSLCTDNVAGDDPDETIRETLAEFGEKQIARILSTESPSVAAVLVARLEAQAAANILTHLPPEMQTQVMLRVATQPTKMAEEIFKEIVGTIRSRLADSQQISQAPNAGLAKLGALLSTINLHDRGLLVRRLAKEDQTVAAKLSGVDNSTLLPATSGSLPITSPREPRGQYRFDDLMGFDNRTLKIVVRSISHDVLALALIGADGQFVDRILGLLPLLRLRTFQKKMRRMGPVRLSDVEQAQRAVAECVAEMERSGEISPNSNTRHLNMAA